MYILSFTPLIHSPTARNLFARHFCPSCDDECEEHAGIRMGRRGGWLGQTPENEARAAEARKGAKATDKTGISSFQETLLNSKTSPSYYKIE